MNLKKCNDLIEAAGGPSEMARKLGLQNRQQVINWRKRGIPASIILDNYSQFKKWERGIKK